MARTPIVILGAGGFGREVYDVLEAMASAQDAGEDTNAYEFVGFLDDGEPDLGLLDGRGAAYLGKVTALEGLALDVEYVIGIGSGSVRRRLDVWASGLGRTAAVLVHPRSALGRHRVSLSPGAIICAHVSVTTNVAMGRHSHLNLNATVGHDVLLGDYVTVNPGANVSGGVVLEDEVTIGTGAAVIQGVRVGARTVVGASAAVVRDLPPDVVAVGVPAKART